MKIIGGEFKGRNFYMPKGIRPTQNITRKALFDLIGHDLEGVEFLDLFAGSGAIGLEAISRNAAKVVMVEKDPKIFATIEDNLSLLGLTNYSTDGVKIAAMDMDVFVAIKEMAAEGAKFDVIFIDPPYGRELAKKALKTLNAYDILQPNCLVVIEHHKREILPDEMGRFCIYRQKKYGSSHLTIFQINDESQP